MGAMMYSFLLSYQRISICVIPCVTSQYEGIGLLLSEAYTLFNTNDRVLYLKKQYFEISNLTFKEAIF